MDYKSGYVPFHGHQTFYEIFGKCDPGKYPLVCLHGGPGIPHEYIVSMKGIADSGRAVIFYDQIGCGKSVADLPDEEYTEDLFCDELDAVREALGLDTIHLLGQSCGGMLAQHYLLYHGEPRGILSVTLASTMPSMKIWGEEGARYQTYMTPEMQKAIKEANEAGDYSSEEYQKAEALYYQQHVCALDPYPPEVDYAFNNIGPAYELMQGHCEFDISGNLKDWDSTEDLHKIQIPALLIHGNNDESTPYINKAMYDRIPDCEWHIIQYGTHLCHVEYPDEFNGRVARFLNDVEEKLK